MANHGKTGASLDAYRKQKRLRKTKNPSKGLTKRREARAKVAEAKAKVAEAEALKAKEAADFAALEAAEQAPAQ